MKRAYNKLTEENKLKAIALFQEGNKVLWIADKLSLNRLTLHTFLKKHFNVNSLQSLTTEIMRKKIIEDRKTKTVREVAAKYNMGIRNVNEYTKSVTKELLFKKGIERTKNTKVSENSLKHVKKENDKIDVKPNKKKVKNIKVQKESKNKRELSQTKITRQFPEQKRKIRIDHKTEIEIYPGTKKWNMTDEEIIKIYKKI